MKKYLTLVASFVLVAALAVGGTLAYLTDQTDAIVNTFTVGNINISLDESDELDLKMVPGKEITKDPVVTVTKNSEACWLFVKVEKSSNFDTFMSFEIADGWTELENGVYYRQVPSNTTADESFDVLKGDKVTVKTTVTKVNMDGLIADDPATDDVNESTYPTLSFTAYAVQLAGFATAADAWAEF